MQYKVKTGRRALSDERERAQKLVDTYGPAIPTPENPQGGYCLNPQDEIEDQIRVDAEQVGPALLDAICRFARTGTFAFTDINFEHFSMQEEFRLLRRKGTKYGDAVSQIAEKYGRTVRTVERAVSTDKK